MPLTRTCHTTSSRSSSLQAHLLPNPTMNQIIATGFNRNHRINTEGGVVPEEWRIETVIDRVETTSATWLGLTTGCARCHDHKYDPISQKDFYSLCAYFNNVPETGSGQEAPVNVPPVIKAPYPSQQARMAFSVGESKIDRARREDGQGRRNKRYDMACQTWQPRRRVIPCALPRPQDQDASPGSVSGNRFAVRRRRRLLANP